MTPDSAATLTSRHTCSTAVMVSEYFAAPLQGPMAFASRDDMQYPKVAIGRWPPSVTRCRGR